MDLTEKQRWLLHELQEATDKASPLHKSGDATVSGLVVRGAAIKRLERMGLASFAGWCVEVDGDGFSVTGNDDAPYYAITDAGRAALADSAKEGG